MLGLYVPEGQDVHNAKPVVAPYVPPGQRVHDEVDVQVDDWNLPTLQVVQLEVEEVVFKYCPAVHLLDELQAEEEVLPTQL